VRAPNSPKKFRRQKIAASSKALRLKEDRAFIGDFLQTQRALFAALDLDNPEHFCGFPSDPLCLTPCSNFAGAPLGWRCVLRVERWYTQAPLGSCCALHTACAGPRLMACSPWEVLGSAASRVYGLPRGSAQQRT
jgi:hypothetical protein